MRKYNKSKRKNAKRKLTQKGRRSRNRQNVEVYMRNYNHIGGEGSLDKHVNSKTEKKPAFKQSSAYPRSTQKKIDPSSIQSRRLTLKKKSNSIHPTSSIETSSKPNNKATQTSPYFNEIPTRIKQKKTEKSKGILSQI